MKKNRSIYNSIVANVKYDLENSKSTGIDLLKYFATDINLKATADDSGFKKFGSAELFHRTVELKMHSSSIKLFTLFSKKKLPELFVATWLSNEKEVEKAVISKTSIIM